jgi:hypothetical protein
MRWVLTYEAYAPVTTGPYAVVNGHTFYSGNVYVSIPGGIAAADNCGNILKRSNTGQTEDILTLASSAVYTMRGMPHNNIPFEINYADFNPPTPWR